MLKKFEVKDLFNVTKVANQLEMNLYLGFLKLLKHEKARTNFNRRWW